MRASDFSNSAFTTTLSASITSTATSITVASGGNFPSTAGSQFLIRVGSEIMLVTAGAGTTSWTVTRGMDGTTEAAHSSGKTVHLMTAPPLLGIYTAANTSTSPGQTPSTSQTWPWPNDSGTTLSNYLTTNVYTPASLGSPPRLLLTTDAVYQQDHAALQLELCGRQRGDDAVRLADPLLRHRRQYRPASRIPGH